MGKFLPLEVRAQAQDDGARFLKKGLYQGFTKPAEQVCRTLFAR
jgi:hypothetical protein